MKELWRFLLFCQKITQVGEPDTNYDDFDMVHGYPELKTLALFKGMFEPLSPKQSSDRCRDSTYVHIINHPTSRHYLAPGTTLTPKESTLYT